MSMQSEIIEAIRSAWADATPPRSGTISTSTCDEGVTEYFGGTPWHVHTAAQLRSLDYAPNIFSDEAFAYYLPAYMIGDIEEPVVSDTNVERVLFWLSANRGSAVISRLSEMQRLATRAYIEFIQQREQGLYDDECSTILRSLDYSKVR